MMVISLASTAAAFKNKNIMCIQASVLLRTLQKQCGDDLSPKHNQGRRRDDDAVSISTPICKYLMGAAAEDGDDDDGKYMRGSEMGVWYSEWRYYMCARPWGFSCCPSVRIDNSSSSSSSSLPQKLKLVQFRVVFCDDETIISLVLLLEKSWPQTPPPPPPLARYWKPLANLDSFRDERGEIRLLSPSLSC